MTKTDIINWIAACKAKALKSIKNDCTEYLFNSANDFPELQKHLAIYEKINDNVKYLKEAYPNHNLLYGYPSTFIYGKCNAGIQVECKAALIYFFYSDNKELYHIQINAIEAFCQKYVDVKSEYNRLQAQVKNMRKIPKMIDYLDSLGFDISTIKENPQVQVNKDLLFVCHDNKPDEVK